ncbi:MAG: alpha-2-macroglobulin, partial [Betaproteobacteria bacterium]|nr:alpha-2-macroglobulin [Betaproteobacteria bacterium]
MRSIRGAAVAILVLALSAALVLAAGPRPAQAAGLASFSPSGEVGLVREVRAVFSEPMIRLGDSGAPDPFLIDCPVKGDSRWVDNRTWVHVFRTPPRAGTRCGFSLRPELRTLGGEALAGRARQEFSTGGPVVARSMPWEGSRIDEDQSFLLVLTGPVDPDSVTRKAWCRAAGVGERVPVRLLPPAERDLLARRFAPDEPDVLALACARPLPPQARVDLVWDAGIATPSGLATRRPQSLGYEVRSAFSARLSCPRENANAPCLPLGDIRIEFSAPVPRAQAAAVRLMLGQTERKPRLEGGADAPTVEAVVFPGPWPESASVNISLPPGLRDADQRPLTNAAAFPMSSRIGTYPPLAKFAAAPFGIIELDAAPAMPLALRKVERSLTLREAQPGRGLVRDLRLQDDASIIAWYSKVLRLHESVVEPALARELT